MTSPVEEMQDPALTSIAIEPGNYLELSPNDLPNAEAATVRFRALAWIQVPGTAMKQLVCSGIARIEVLVETKLIGPIRDKWTVAGEGVSVHGNGTLIETGHEAGEGVSVHGNGTPTEPGHEAGDLEDGGSLTVNSQGGFTDNPDQESTEGLRPEEADQASVGSALLDDFTDPARMAEYLRNPKTYLSGLLVYGLHSSLGMLKEGFPRPTPAKKALWYLLFVNVGTIFVLATPLAWAPRGSAKARLLVKCITAAGVLMFGLNLALLYLKYQP